MKIFCNFAIQKQIGMEKRSEKDQQAYDMLQKLPKLQLTAVENKERWRGHSTIFLCIINGNVFVLLSGFGDYKSVTAMRKHQDEGLIATNEMIPIRAIGKSGGPVWMAAANVLQRFEKELLALVRFGTEHILHDQIEFASSWLEHNTDGGGLNSYKMSPEEIDNAHFHYKERYRLLNEAHDEFNKKIASNIKKENYIGIDENDTVTLQNTANEEQTLKELVDRIEAMGWTVTLHRKDEATDNNMTSVSTCQTALQIPAWYDDATYQLLSKELVEFDIPETILKILDSVNITTLGQLVAMKRTDFLKMKNFGRKKLTLLDDMLENYGLEFGCNLEEWHRARKIYLATK